MQRILLLSLLLVPISTSTLSERTLSDFGSLNLGLWSIDLNEVYDFFASPAVQRNFFIVQTSKVGGNGVEQCCQLFIHVRPSGEFLAFLSAMHSGRGCEATRRYHPTQTSKDFLTLRSMTTPPS